MEGITLTDSATILLAVIGVIQAVVLIEQKNQTRIALIAEYRQLWREYRLEWGNIIFIGRNDGEYYQVVNGKRLQELLEDVKKYTSSAPTIWARESAQKVFGFLGEVSTRLLQGHMHVSDIYPILGTEFLRQSKPLRQLLEPCPKNELLINLNTEKHLLIRDEIQDWLIYHDGLRRRCLILMDLLWAEAVRLEDLPPDEIQNAADAKKITGKLNRKRIFKEAYRLNGLEKFWIAIKLSQFLKRSEFFSFFNWLGIKKKRLNYLKAIWMNRILRNNE